MDSGILLNNHDELSAALRNIRKTDSDGEEVEDDEEESEEEEGDEEESGDEENDGKILNPQVSPANQTSLFYCLGSAHV